MGLKYLNSLRIRDPGWRQFGSGIWDGKKPDMEILIIFVSSQGYTEDTVRIFVNCVYWCRNVSYKEEIFKKGKLKKLEITFGPKMALASAQGHWRGQKSLSPLWKARFSLSTPSIGPRYGFPLLKIIISRNIYRMGTLIVIIACKVHAQGYTYLDA